MSFSPSLRSLSSLQAAAAVPERLRVQDILAFAGFSGSVVVAGATGLSRDLEQVNVMQVPTDRYAKRDELILSAATAFECFGGEAESLVAALAARRVAALAIRGASAAACLGAPALRVADQESLPVIELPAEAHLNELQAEVLDRIVAWQGRQLRIAEAVRDRLSSDVLSGLELEGLPLVVADIIGGDAALFDAEGTLIAASGSGVRPATRGVGRWLAEDRSDPVAFGDSWVIWPVLVGTKRLGCLAGHLEEPLRVVHLSALEYGATVAALKILQRQETSEAQARLVMGLVRDLFSGSLDEASALRRAMAVGWHPEHDYWAILSACPDSGVARIPETIRALVPGALVAERSSGWLAVMASEHLEADRGLALDPVGSLGERLADVHESVHVGISSRHRGLASLPVAVGEAEEALRVAQLFDGRTRVRAFDRVGILRLLLNIPPEDLRAFPASVLGPVDRLPPPFRGPLMLTLEFLIECGLNVAETARRGGWHYNTVRSRTARLCELLGPFMDEGPRLVAVELAILLRRELARQTA